MMASSKELLIEYDPKDFLGRGGFGFVFRGTFRKANKDTPIPVAVKRVQIVPGPSFPSREEEALIKLNHENVVKLYHVENQGEFRCYVLELCDASLDKAFLPDDDPKKYRGPLPSPESVLLQLAQGLAYIHSQRLAHRDIKPQNVLISSRNLVVTMKWAGLGLSNPVDSKGFYSISGIRGTLDWMAPEVLDLLDTERDLAQIRGTIASDVFAAGCLFFYHLTGGNHPFGKGVDITSNIKNGKQVNLKKLDEKHFAYGIIGMMLTNQPEKRLDMDDVVKKLPRSEEIGYNTAKHSNFRKSQLETEFADLCSLPEPIDEEVNQLRRMVQFDDVDVNQPGDDGNPPLVQLLRSNRKGKSLKDSIEALLMKDGQVLDVNKRDERGYNALHLLCINCDQHAGNLADIIRLLVENGMKAGERDPEGKNALHHLCKKYKKDNLLGIIRLLNVTVEDVNCKDFSSWAPLHYLCRWYQNAALIDIVELFLKRGAYINIKTSEMSKEWTALHFLCQFYKEKNLKDVIQLLIANGADVNGRTSDGFNALHFLCKRYHDDPSVFEVVRLLVSKGIDVTAKTSTRATTFTILEENDPDGENTKEVVQLLLKNAKTLPPAPENRSKDQNVKQFNKIHYTELLGSGCYAHIFQGTYTATKGADLIDVAVKRVIRQSQTDRELEALRTLKEHPNVVKFYDFEDQHTDRLYALELCQGTLDQAFLSDDDDRKYRGPLPSPANLLVQLCRGLDHIHFCGLAHRDIKPDNILISSTGPRAIAKWADFGLSKPIDAQGVCVLSKVSAARHYWSPETYEALKKAEANGQLTSDYAIVGENEKGTASSDIFAFGCLMFWFLSGGLHPFGSQSNVKTNVEAGNPVNLHILSRHYALPFIKKMLNHRPKEREGVLKELVDHILTSNKLETEFFDLSSLSLPIPEEVNQLRRMVLFDGIDVNQTDPSSGMTPLMYLCASNRPGEILKRSVISLMARKEQEIQVNKKDTRGRTALHYLCINYTHPNLIDIVRLLVERGVDVNCKTLDGWTALHLLCRHYTHDNLIDIFRLLVEAGADFNYRTPDGWTALHLLCRHYTQDNLIDIVWLLVDKGADVNCKDEKGRTPIHFLCHHYTAHDNLVDIVRLLVENGADVDTAVTSTGMTEASALDLLRRSGKRNPEVRKLLREKVVRQELGCVLQ